MLKRDPISDRGISVILPVHNEAETLSEAIARISGLLDEKSRGYEIIIVNDGSADQTGTHAEQFATENKHIHLLAHSRRLGAGAALRTGFRAAKYPLVLQLDRPRQFDHEVFKRLIQGIDEVDMVCGYRQRQSGSGFPWRYWLYRTLLRLVFGVHIRDVDSGIRLYRRAALRRITIQSDGHLAGAEIIAKATLMNMLIGEVAIGLAPINYDVSEPVFDEAVQLFRHPQFRASNAAADSADAVSGGSPRATRREGN
jgi:glycosyltransferase involved in cell wall biosynthesis